MPGCGRTTSTTGRGKITFGSYADPAQNVLKEVFLPEFEKKTGIETEWVEADFSSWFQKAVNDGQTQAGAFDIYVLDDLWMPRFAGAGYLANLEELGFHPDTDFVESALDLGYWPPKTGPRQPGIDPKARPTLLGCHSLETCSCSSIGTTYMPAARLRRGMMCSEWPGKDRILRSDSTVGSLAV